MSDTNVTGRIKEIIEKEGHTVSSFAAEIKVIRSTVSHIISGRNKPSLEFVQKLLLRYPEIDPAWLLFGKDTQNRSEGSVSSPSLLATMNEAEADHKSEEAKDSTSEPNQLSKNSDSKEVLSDHAAKSIDNKAAQPLITSQSIEQIVFFYKDGSFKVYKQGNS